MIDNQFEFDARNGMMLQTAFQAFGLGTPRPERTTTALAHIIPTTQPLDKEYLGEVAQLYSESHDQFQVEHGRWGTPKFAETHPNPSPDANVTLGGSTSKGGYWVSPLHAGTSLNPKDATDETFEHSVAWSNFTKPEKDYSLPISSYNNDSFFSDQKAAELGIASVKVLSGRNKESDTREDLLVRVNSEIGRADGGLLHPWWTQDYEESKTRKLSPQTQSLEETPTTGEAAVQALATKVMPEDSKSIVKTDSDNSQTLEPSTRIIDGSKARTYAPATTWDKIEKRSEKWEAARETRAAYAAKEKERQSAYVRRMNPYATVAVQLDPEIGMPERIGKKVIAMTGQLNADAKQTGNIAIPIILDSAYKTDEDQSVAESLTTALGDLAEYASETDKDSILDTADQMYDLINPQTPYTHTLISIDDARTALANGKITMAQYEQYYNAEKAEDERLAALYLALSSRKHSTQAERILGEIEKEDRKLAARENREMTEKEKRDAEMSAIATGRVEGAENLSDPDPNRAVKRSAEEIAAERKLKLKAIAEKRVLKLGGEEKLERIEADRKLNLAQKSSQLLKNDVEALPKDSVGKTKTIGLEQLLDMLGADSSKIERDDRGYISKKGLKSLPFDTINERVALGALDLDVLNYNDRMAVEAASAILHYGLRPTSKDAILEEMVEDQNVNANKQRTANKAKGIKSTNVKLNLNNPIELNQKNLDPNLIKQDETLERNRQLAEYLYDTLMPHQSVRDASNQQTGGHGAKDEIKSSRHMMAGGRPALRRSRMG